MNDGDGGGVCESGAPVLFWNGEAEYSQSICGSQFPKEGKIECFGSIVVQGLRFHLRLISLKWNESVGTCEVGYEI